MVFVRPEHARFAEAPEAPLLPLREGVLLVNGPPEVNLLRALRNESETFDHVDLIVAFLPFSGVRLLLPTLEAFFARGGRMRRVTTIYTGDGAPRPHAFWGGQRGARRER